MYCKPNKDSLSRSVIAIRCGVLSTCFFRENRAPGIPIKCTTKEQWQHGIFLMAKHGSTLFRLQANPIRRDMTYTRIRYFELMHATEAHVIKRPKNANDNCLRFR